MRLNVLGCRTQEIKGAAHERVMTKSCCNKIFALENSYCAKIKLLCYPPSRKMFRHRKLGGPASVRRTRLSLRLQRLSRENVCTVRTVAVCERVVDIELLSLLTHLVMLNGMVFETSEGIKELERLNDDIKNLEDVSSLYTELKTLN